MRRVLPIVVFFAIAGLPGCTIYHEVGPEQPATLAATTAGGKGWDQSNGVTVDKWGNSYITGFFRAPARFGTKTLSTSGSSDIFIAKYDAQLNLVWVTPAGGPDFDQGVSVAVDDSGNVYVTGAFFGKAVFGSTTLTAPGQDIFVARLDSDGRFVWAKKGAGTGSGLSIKTDGTYVYASGYFTRSVRLSGIEMLSQGGNDMFLVKYDAESGAVQWSLSAGGYNNDAATSLAIDSRGNIYLGGQFFDLTTFGGITIRADRLYQGFVAKFDGDGHALWAQHIGGADYPTNVSLAVDPSGYCYVIGNFTRHMTLGGTSLNTTGRADLYLAKLQPWGDVVWLRNAGGSLGASSIAVDRSGNTYLTGPFTKEAFFGDYSLESVEGDADIFVSKFNTAGTIQWTTQGSFNSYFRDAIAVDNSGAVTITGCLNGQATLGSVTLESPYSQKDVFLWRMGN